MSKITVIDSPCGYGKTSFAIQMMKNREDDKFVYITPFLPEIERVINACDNRVFYTPNNKNTTKKTDFKFLIYERKNVVSTHALFKSLDEDICSHFEDYVLILDEVADVVEQVEISKADLEMLLDTKRISVDEKGKVTWLDKEYIGKLTYVKNLIEKGKVYMHNNVLLLWVFPCEIFASFKEVYILTYMFKGQIQRYYYDLNNINYKYKSVTKKEDTYILTEHVDIGGNEYKNLINIYEGKLNNIGNHNSSLSSTWYKNNQSKESFDRLQLNTENYFRYNVKPRPKSEYIMWTCFKGGDKNKYVNKLKGKGYSKGWVECNARATNEYQHKTCCAYLVNKYYMPTLKNYFISNGVNVDEDTWALSELIQWLFRSRIRNKEPIDVYIPSSRMRKLLQDWLNN